MKILLREPEEWRNHLMLNVRESLNLAGHVAEFADRSLLEMKMDPGRVARFVKRTPADAWVVTAGSREVLEWFARQPIPSFALFGRLRTVPLAGASTLKAPVIASLMRRLGALGHRRIVFIVREEHRRPDPNPAVRTFLEELEALGVGHGPYNIPNWEETPRGFHQCLVSLFQHTPPTALIIDKLALYFVILHFLAQRGIRPLWDVSMVCLDPIPSANWFTPMISDVRYDSRKWIRRILRWAHNVARGIDDRRQAFAKVEFMEGGTIGPAPRKKYSSPFRRCCMAGAAGACIGHGNPQAA